MPITLWLLLVPAIAAGAAVARPGAARNLLALAAALLAFAVASAAVAAGVTLDAPLDLAALSAVPPTIRWVSGALLLAAAALAAAGALIAARHPRDAARTATAPAAVVPPARDDRRDAAVVAVGALLVFFGPHLAIVALGALAVAIASHRIVRRWGEVVAVPVLPLLAAAGLAALIYYARIIAGDIGLGMDQLVDVPFSPSAALMLAPMLALAAIGFFGLAPLGRLVPGPALALVGVSLMVRIGHVALGDGLADWQTVLVPLGVVALGHAAVTRRAASAAAALAWLGAVIATRSAATGAIWLAGAAALASLVAGSRPLMVRHPVALAVAAGGAAWGAVLVLDAMLRAEVVYAVVMWAAVLVAIARTAGARTGRVGTG